MLILGEGVHALLRTQKKKSTWRANDENTGQCLAIWVWKMNISVEQQYAIKFYVLLKKMATETTTLLQEAFGAEVFGGSTIRHWHKDLKASWESVELQPRRSVLRTIVTEVNISTVAVGIAENHILIVRAITAQLNINKETVCRILMTELRMKHLRVLLVPIFVFKICLGVGILGFTKPTISRYPFKLWWCVSTR